MINKNRKKKQKWTIFVSVWGVSKITVPPPTPSNKNLEPFSLDFPKNYFSEK